MSMTYWGIVMHGISENDVKFKEGFDFCSFSDLRDADVVPTVVTLPNGKNVEIGVEVSEENAFIGFYAGYPWEDYMENIKEEDVNEAIYQVLKPYVDNDKEDIFISIEDINTYNCR